MMPTLVTNVISQIVQVRLANRKRAVSVLPGECAEFISLCFDPFGRARFDFFYELANRNRSAERANDVNVIIAAADFVRRAAQLTAYTGDVFRELVFNFDVNPRVSIFRREDQMDQDVG